MIKRFANIKGGLVLVTGPTGSGKSTTLAALIDYINSSYARHIITIEEPIEFVHNNKLSIITQREVGEDTPSFADGLNNAMREDADVVLVGEMRDLETIALALTAAETGMLVFGTLHTNNARKTVDRMIDVFPSSQQPQVRTMLAASLRGIVAQLLLKKKDGKGRVAVNEILISNSAVSSIIREGAVEKLTDVLISGKGEGMQFMDDAIQRLLRTGPINAAGGLHEGDRQGPLRAVPEGRGRERRRALARSPTTAASPRRPPPCRRIDLRSSSTCRQRSTHSAGLRCSARRSSATGSEIRKLFSPLRKAALHDLDEALPIRRRDQRMRSAASSCTATDSTSGGG